MANKNLNHEIISYTYKTNGKIHTATVANQENAFKKISSKDVLPELNNDCQCGETKCVNKQIWRCMDIDGDGTCVWFITNEPC